MWKPEISNQRVYKCQKETLSNGFQSQKRIILDTPCFRNNDRSSTKATLLFSPPHFSLRPFLFKENGTFETKHQTGLVSLILSVETFEIESYLSIYRESDKILIRFIRIFYCTSYFSLSKSRGFLHAAFSSIAF